MDLEQTNLALFRYLESHGRLPQKGLLRRRQFTWDEMVSYAKENLGRYMHTKYVDEQIPEYLNIYLKLTFSVDGWWREREGKLLLSGRLGEVVALDRLFMQRPLDFFKSYP